MTSIWESYDSQRREQYIESIQALGAFSPLFRQKSEDSNDKTAFISSKYQETMFARIFEGAVVDKGNDPYDVMVPSPAQGKRDLIGIKTFLNTSSAMQKVMQFKKVANAEGWSGWVKNQEYEKLVRRISKLRNQKLRSTQSLLAGAGYTPETAFQNIFYHYLSPLKNGYVYIGEHDYSFMDEENLSFTEPADRNKVTSLYFTDGKNKYKYTPADSTLYMEFAHREEQPSGDIVGKFKVEHLEDPHEALVRRVHGNSGNSEASGSAFAIQESVSTENNSSIQSPQRNSANYVVFPLFRLSKQGNTLAGDIDKKSGLNVRHSKPKNKGSDTGRPVNEVEIRIPNSKEFHEKYPLFFGKTSSGEPRSSLVKKKNKNKNVWKSPLSKDDRTFMLTLSQSAVSMEAIITGDRNKQIMSRDKQTILGSWILSQVFQLQDDEVLTRSKLDELGLDGIKLTRLGDSHIGMEFIKVKEEDLNHLWPAEPDKFRELALVEDNDE